MYVLGGDKSVSEKVSLCLGGLCYLSLVSKGMYRSGSEGRTMIA